MPEIKAIHKSHAQHLTAFLIEIPHVCPALRCVLQSLLADLFLELWPPLGEVLTGDQCSVYDPVFPLAQLLHQEIL